jgi:hypothetical protein
MKVNNLQNNRKILEDLKIYKYLEEEYKKSKIII